ncbi:MAG: type II toxin-antitoxin system RelE/ParE family toxin [Deltaproteobacteria bacterium]|nr:type II toxin-antitoxin system RelE/ParE family toxin [Deltaproteobacteria bacterium]
MFEAPALRELERLEERDRARVLSAAEALADNPRPPGCAKVRGSPYWRIRVGVFRVLYEIQGDSLVVLVVRIGHRREVYRGR